MGVRGVLLYLAAAPVARGLLVNDSQRPVLPTGPVPQTGPGPGTRALAWSRGDAPIYLEVVGSASGSRAGPVAASVEQNFMSTLVPGSSAFKLLDDDLAAHDDLYKSKLLNYLTGEISRNGLSCMMNQYCIADWYRQLDPEKAAKLRDVYTDSLNRGCMTVGGCRAATKESFTAHLKQSDNVIFETQAVDYPAMQTRMGIVQSVGNYRARTMGLVCTPYSEIEQSDALTTAQSILNFVQRPRTTPAPVLKDALNGAMTQRATLCTFADILSCMSRKIDSVVAGSGRLPCEPSPDGVYVWANTQQTGLRLVAFVEAGVAENDENVQKAREMIHRSMPPGVPACGARA